MTIKEKTQLALNVGKTARLMKKGLTASEIAKKLNKPESSVRQWIDIVNKAETNKKTK